MSRRHRMVSDLDPTEKQMEEGMQLEMLSTHSASLQALSRARSTRRRTLNS